MKLHAARERIPALASRRGFGGFNACAYGDSSHGGEGCDGGRERGVVEKEICGPCDDAGCDDTACGNGGDGLEGAHGPCVIARRRCGANVVVAEAGAGTRKQ